MDWIKKLILVLSAASFLCATEKNNFFNRKQAPSSFHKSYGLDEIIEEHAEILTKIDKSKNKIYLIGQINTLYTITNYDGVIVVPSKQNSERASVQSRICYLLKSLSQQGYLDLVVGQNNESGQFHRKNIPQEIYCKCHTKDSHPTFNCMKNFFNLYPEETVYTVILSAIDVNAIGINSKKDCEQKQKLQLQIVSELVNSAGSSLDNLHSLLEDLTNLEYKQAEFVFKNGIQIADEKKASSAAIIVGREYLSDLARNYNGTRTLYVLKPKIIDKN